MCYFSWNILFSINKNRVGNTEIEAGVVEGVVYSFYGCGVVVVSRGLFEATMIGLLAFALKYALCVRRVKGLERMMMKASLTTERIRTFSSSATQKMQLTIWRNERWRRCQSIKNKFSHQYQTRIEFSYFAKKNFTNQGQCDEGRGRCTKEGLFVKLLQLTYINNRLENTFVENCIESTVWEPYLPMYEYEIRFVLL